MTSTSLIILIFIIFFIWSSGSKSKEIAINLAKKHCKKNNVQFLDDTVNQARIGVRWGERGLYFRRMFYFDFSMSGIGRRTGWIILQGTRIEGIDLDLPNKPMYGNTNEEITQRDLEKKLVKKKVVPFKKPNSDKK